MNKKSSLKELISFFKEYCKLKQDFVFYIIKEDNQIVDLNNFLKENNVKQDTLFIILLSKFNSGKICFDLHEYEKIKLNIYEESDVYIIKKLGKYPFKNIAWLNEKESEINFSTNRELIYNTILPNDYLPIKYETFNHTYFFECYYGLSEAYCKDKNYIEYGVRSCNNLNTVSKFFKKCHGVDIVDYQPDTSCKNISKYIMDTSVFAKDILPSLDFDYCFIDASHNFKDVYNDFQSIFKYINLNGFIFLHDTYPCDESFLHKNACFDCYKTPLKIKQMYKDKIEILTIPLNPGLTIIRKCLE
jgi:hypothetical protein